MMTKTWMNNILFLILVCCWFESGYSDSLTLLNNTRLQLSAQIQDANGNILDEMGIAPGSTTTWSLDYEYFGYDAETTNPPTPYTVTWYCPNGDVYGVCTFVDSDTTVMAKSCGGTQQCPGK